MQKDDYITDYSQISDIQLIESCLERDHEAFQELVNRYLKTIFNFVRQYSQSKDEAEDITQETFFKVWKNLKRFDKRRNFKSWLFAIARNTALDQIKSKKAITFSKLNNEESDQDFEEKIEDLNPLISEILEQKETIQYVLDKLSLLKTNYRIVLHLHYQEDLTFEEISMVMDIPMNTVKSWHHRAIMKLRNLLSK